MNVLNQLREHTATFHKQIEQNPYAKGIMDQSLTMDGYQAYLAKFYGFVEPIERKIASRPEWEANDFRFTERTKADLIASDLRQLGLSEADIEALPRCEELPDVADFEGALGYMYVLEGSTLGGQVIMRQFAKFLPVHPDTNGRYFNSYGEDVRARWGEFRGLLESVTERGGASSEARIVQTATDTFRLLDRWIQQ
ncbi:biliverdin-producing heme oxygenase [Paenibacillus xanthanilyticus]|uniref:Biliverdin-producing heme oxygenase n=1 Tax=Paenibacillus xanthanilyticus TaxID=1783531 RepID=A0ABV8K7H5_9BACL